MKFSVVVADPQGWHVQDLLSAAERVGLKAEAVVLEKNETADHVAQKLGDVILWRASALPNATRRQLLPLLADKFIFNQVFAWTEPIRSKAYQQKIIAADPVLLGIETYQFETLSQLRSAIADGRLSYPAIEKPEFGKCGQGIRKISSEADLPLDDEAVARSVYQPYIPNNGDFRVLVLGGQAIRILKRIGKPGLVVNNISAGGRYELVTDRFLIEKLTRIAARATAKFNLAFSGVDIIQNQATGLLHLMEINTAPQWDITPNIKPSETIDFSERLINYVQTIQARKTEAVPTLVYEYYLNSPLLPLRTRVHWHSRLWLWQKDQISRKILDDCRDDYLNQRRDSTGSLTALDHLSRLRKECLVRFPGLSTALPALFNLQFSKSLYGVDGRDQLLKLFRSEQLNQLRDSLWSDPASLRLLSTHAVNFLYLIEPVLESYDDQLAAKLLELAETNRPKNLVEAKLWAYLLTHAIINASQFYAAQITRDRDVYLEMLSLLDRVLWAFKDKLTLDVRLEVLVCAGLLKTKSRLETLTIDEARGSLSGVGNFIVDRGRGALKPEDLYTSEHRSVLYLMAENSERQIIDYRSGG